MITRMLLLLLFGQVCAPLAQAQDLPPDVEAARVAQDVLPELAARAARAEARLRSAEAWFAGKSSFDAAWPGQAGVDVLDSAYLRAWARQLDAQASARAEERVRPLPVDAEVAKALGDARASTLDLEERVAAAERRLLAGLQAGLARAPGLDATQLAERRRSLQLRMAAAVPDAPPEVVADATSAAQELQQLESGRRAAITAMTVPGTDELTSWAADLLAQEPGLEGVATLQMARPLLSGPQAAAADALIDASEQERAARASAEHAAVLDGLRALVEAPPPIGDEDTQESLVDAVEAAQGRLEAAPTEREREVAELELALAEKRRDIFEGKLAEDATAASQRAEEAREAVEASLEAAAGQDEALASLQGKVVAIQQSVAEVYEAEATRRERGSVRREDLRARLDDRMEAAVAARSRSMVDTERQISIDRAYLDLRTSVRSLYEELDQLREHEKADATDAEVRREAVETWAGERGSPELAALDDAYQEAADGLEEALQSRDRARNATRDEVYRLLDVARDHRRAVRLDASNAARAQARRDFFPELRREVLALPGQLMSGARGVGEVLLGLPAFITNLDALIGFVIGSFELLVLLGVWGVARRQVPGLVQRGLDGLEKRFGATLEGDRTAAHGQLVDLSRGLLDLGTGIFLLGRLPESMGFVGLLLLLAMAWVALRVAPLVARAALSSPQEMHPALRLVTAPTESLAARTLWWLFAWAAASKVGTYAMVTLLDADRLRDVVGAVGSAALWALVIAFVMAWGPVASSTLSKQGEHTSLTAWAAAGVVTGPLSRVLRMPQHVASIVIVGLQTTIHVFGRLIEGRAALGWLQSAIARRQLRADDAEESTAPRRVPEALVAAVHTARDQGMHRPEVEARLRAAYDDWLETGQRGLVSLIGDVGTGKSQLLHHLPEMLSTEVRTVTVESRIDSVDGVASFIGDALGLQARDPEGVQAELAELEPTTIAVQGAHLLFLRRVRGYDPLQALLEWMTMTSDRHFWVLAVHEPSWEYLMGVAARLKMDAFRDHLRLGQVDASAVAEWLEEITRDAGFQISYEGLATTGLLGGDEGLAERRARSAFWRLLANAAGGVPANAGDLWLRSVSESDTEGTLEVRMFEAASVDDIESLKDESLFALTALVQHERLTAEELASVLNRRIGSARTTARLLVGLGIVGWSPTERTYFLPASWAPAVQLLLKQKHFLYTE